MNDAIRTFFAILLATALQGVAAVHAQSQRLDLLSDPAPMLGFSESSAVRVRFSGVDGPIAGAAVVFEATAHTADTRLTPARDTTDAEGVAETVIEAGLQEVDFGITVSVFGDDTVEPLIVRVRVTAVPGLQEAVYPGEFDSIQEAVDALADGGVLTIAEGEHVIDAPISIEGKRIVIQGAGSTLNDKKHKKPFTRLVGRQPRDVLDPGGEVILPVEDAEPLIEVAAADVVVRKLWLTGFDAGIIVREGNGRDSHYLMVTDVLVTRTGRGIVSLSSGEVTIESSAIQQTLWHGVVVFPPLTLINKALLKDTWISDANGAAVYFHNTLGIISNGDIAGGEQGGVVCFDCHLIVMNSHIHANYRTGIFLLLARNAVIVDNVIEDTRPDLFSATWGDGVSSVLSDITVSNNQILDSDRAGISNFGGRITVADSTIQCATFDLEGEPYESHNFAFDDVGENKCGCPTADGPCSAVSAGLEPPEPFGPIE